MYDYTPQVYQQITFAAAHSVSFRDSAESLKNLSDLPLLPKRVWRAAKRIGEERVAECRTAAEQFQKLTLPEQRRNPKPQTPQVACVQMDGGRYQTLERLATETPVPETAADDDTSSEPAGHWREYKGGLLLSMRSEVQAEDPCPQLPETFFDPGKMRKIAREIKGFTSDSQVSAQAHKQADADFKKHPGKPKTLVKSVVASSGDVEVFGPLLANAAYERGFHAAERKAFVADGSSSNWSVWAKFFSHYTPILDFVHALMYVYAAAMAGRHANEGWKHYRDWAQWLWSGAVEPLLAALQQRQQELGLPAEKETGTPRAQVTRSLIYLTNQCSRMNYAEYRRQGLPITSSPMESTIKQINRRIKGSEKFWDEGADPMLHLVADRLSQTDASEQFWSRRLQRLIESASFQSAA